MNALQNSLITLLETLGAAVMAAKQAAINTPAYAQDLYDNNTNSQCARGTQK